MSKISIREPKKSLGALYPALPVLVGTMAKGIPNYITVAMVGWLCYDTLSIGIGRKQYSREWVKKNKCFSINQPTPNIVDKLDYCGMVSGKKVDKSVLFENFYGELSNAPMIKECPVNIECRVVDIIERSVHTVFIGEVVRSYYDEECTVNGRPDFTKIDPILFRSNVAKGFGSYWKIGDKFADAMQVGNPLK